MHDFKHDLASMGMSAIASWQESDDKPRQYVEKQRHYSDGKGPYSQGYGLSSQRSHKIVRVEPQRRQNTKELMPSNCGAEDF